MCKRFVLLYTRFVHFPAPSDTQNKHTAVHIYTYAYVNVFPLYFCFIVCESVCCATCTKHLTLSSLGGGEMWMGDKKCTMLIKLTVQLPRMRDGKRTFRATKSMRDEFLNMISTKSIHKKALNNNGPYV